MWGYIEKLRGYLRVSGVSSASRRYFVMNFFDGAMTMLGITVGAFATGSVHPRTIIGAGLGASLAMGISGFSGTYMAERAERLRRYKKLRKAMLADLKRSMHSKAFRIASLWAAFVDGVSPALAAAVSMIPFALALVGVIRVEHALVFSILLIMAMIFGLGAFLGKISRENIFLSGFKMILVGVVTALICLLLAAI